MVLGLVTKYRYLNLSICRFFMVYACLYNQYTIFMHDMYTVCNISYFTIAFLACPQA